MDPLWALHARWLRLIQEALRTEDFEVANYARSGLARCENLIVSIETSSDPTIPVRGAK